MRICVLLPAKDEDVSPCGEFDPTCDPRPWLTEHQVDLVQIRKATADAQLAALAAAGYDVFINLCDGVPGDGHAGDETIQALERLGLPYTGPTLRLHSLTKAEMKGIALASGVATPAYRFAYSPGDIERAAQTLRFPLIVKHHNGYGSVGLTLESRVNGPDQLRQQAQKTIADFGGALIEEFIEGDEYTVLVVESPDSPLQPLALTPLVCRFPPGASFKHFDLKWREYGSLGWVPSENQALSQRLKEAACRLFVGTAAVSYSRCDFRVDAKGEVWFLEINTSCGIFYPEGEEGSADLILQHDPIGHRGFLNHIIRCARARAGLFSKQL